MDIRTKRVYGPANPEDGTRILVDRLWPRGLTKDKVNADWMKQIAPSHELRKWFHHEQHNWEEFKQRYFDELDENQDAVEKLLAEAGKGRITLLYSAKDEKNNQAVALREYLLKKSKNT
jgi:uncharacterized protein YeaO (DUF488 family)